MLLLAYQVLSELTGLLRKKITISSADVVSAMKMAQRGTLESILKISILKNY